jgi:hypothetical protein
VLDAPDNPLTHKLGWVQQRQPARTQVPGPLAAVCPAQWQVDLSCAHTHTYPVLLADGQRNSNARDGKPIVCGSATRDDALMCACQRQQLCSCCVYCHASHLQRHRCVPATPMSGACAQHCCSPPAPDTHTPPATATSAATRARLPTHTHTHTQGVIHTGVQSTCRRHTAPRQTTTNRAT